MDERSQSDPPQKTNQTDWGTAKERFEAEKLAIELKNYEQRLRLSDDKLAYDVRDWYFRIISALVTVISSAVFFFLGIHYQHVQDAGRDRVEEARRQQEDFNNNLKLLGDKDPGVRMVAVAGLRPYVTAGEQLPAGDPGRDWPRLASEAVALRMLEETDNSVIEEYSRLLTAASETSLPYVVKLNQYAALRFARAAAGYVGASLSDPGKFYPDGCQNPVGKARQEEIARRVDDLQTLIVHAPMPFEGERDADSSIRVKLTSVTYMLQGDAQNGSGPLSKAYYPACRGVIAKRLNQKNGAELASQASDAVTQAAQVLSASSLTLTRILKSLNATAHLPAGSDLGGAFVVTGNLDGLRLNGANLRESYLDSNAKDFTCATCDFSYADLTHFYPLSPFAISGRFNQTKMTGDLKKQVRQLSP